MISKNLRKFRILRGLTQKELGRKIGVVQSTVGRIENNLTIPSYEILDKIIKVLKVSMEELKGQRKKIVLEGVKKHLSTRKGDRKIQFEAFLISDPKKIPVSGMAVDKALKCKTSSFYTIDTSRPSVVFPSSHQVSKWKVTMEEIKE